jgi:hypothetical protein
MPTREITWQKVRTACRALAESRKPINIKSVAEKAGVSRPTIYNDRKLRNFVEKYEISFHYQKGRDEAHTGYDAGYKDGLAAGRAAAGSHRSSGSLGLAWARGVLHIDPNARLSGELVKKHFRELSHLLHPDKGGKDDLQRALIDAYQLLKQEVGE